MQHAEEMGKYRVGLHDSRAFILGQGGFDLASKCGALYLARNSYYHTNDDRADFLKLYFIKRL